MVTIPTLPNRLGIDVVVSDLVPRDRVVYGPRPDTVIVHPRTFLCLSLELDPYLTYAQRCVGHELIRMYERRLGCLPARDWLMRRVRRTDH